MKKPRLLVACEYSQRVTTAFLEKGFDAYSCDVIDTEGNFPERHFKMDARDVLYKYDWDLVIAHPPCTYLTATRCSNKGCNPYKDFDAYQLMQEAREFFMFFWLYEKCPICVENPRPVRIANLPRETQVVTPTMFGSRFRKRTYLWLRDLPPLLPTHCEPLNHVYWGSLRRTVKGRSLIDVYFAKAMADQWAPLFL